MNPDVREIVAQAGFAHLATLLPDGSPHSVPVWTGVEGDRIVFFTQEGTRKARNLDGDSRVAFSILDEANPYRSAWVRGRVVERRTGEEALRTIDRIAASYTGEAFPMRSGVVFVVEVERCGVITLPFRR